MLLMMKIKRQSNPKRMAKNNESIEISKQNRSSMIKSHYHKKACYYDKKRKAAHIQSRHDKRREDIAGRAMDRV